MPKLTPLSPPYDPALVNVIMKNNGFRETLNSIIYKQAQRRWRAYYGGSKEDSEDFQKYRNMGKSYVAWRSGDRPAPPRPSGRMTNDDLREIASLIDDALAVYVKDLRRALDHYDDVKARESSSSLADLLT